MKTFTIFYKRFKLNLIYFIVFNATFSIISAYIIATSFSGERSRNTRRERTLFCNLQSRAQTHAVLVIGLYELLGNSTT
jgi:hypothetical protein